jgi:hypothetical protein
VALARCVHTCAAMGYLMLRDRCRRLVVLAVAALTVSVVGCTSGTTESNPGTPSTDPLNLAGTWTGSASDSSGGGTMTWTLQQNGGSLSGTVTANATDPGGLPVTGRGTVTGAVSGSAFTFALTIPNGGFDGAFTACTTSTSGTGTATSITLTGTYSGTTTCNANQTIATGQFTLNKQ